MNVLVIGIGAWIDTSSLGNTFSNFFENWEDVKFYNLYFRGTPPQNSVCDDYFSITDMSILKNFFTPENIGCRVYKSDDNNEQSVASREKKLISYIHKFNLNFMYKFEEFLFGTDKWKNEKLDEFIKEADPDVVFTFAVGNNFTIRTAEYIKEITGAKVVSFIADDVHTQYTEKRNKLGRHMLANLERLFAVSDRIYGISQQMCDKYAELTGKSVQLLRKSCREMMPLKTEYKLPLKIVYAGNLLYGRDRILCNLAKALNDINCDGDKAQLEVYSGNELSPQMKKELEFENTSKFMGECPYSKITEILKNADIVLHVESFDESSIELVRYSFSTKIIDCLQSGNVVMAIGPDTVASISYLKEIDGTVVIDDENKIFEIVSSLVNESAESLKLRAQRLREFALKNHNSDSNRKKLKAEFAELMG